MQCKTVKEYLYLLADSELAEDRAKVVWGHLARCGHCQEEWKSIQEFKGLLQLDRPAVTPSVGFESRFWGKISQRQRGSWFGRILESLDSLIPHPSATQIAMVTLTAFLIGGTGGAFSAMNSSVSLESQRTSVQYLSGFREFQGLPSSSVAANYLKVIRDRNSA